MKPDDIHFAMAAVAYARGGGAASQIDCVEYHLNPRLLHRFEQKKREYDNRYGAGRHSVLLAFHGTQACNVLPIIQQGFKLSKVGSSTERGFYGAGIYFPEQFGTSAECTHGGNMMLLCRLLLGKPYDMQGRVQHGRTLQPGYTSHVSNPHGTEMVMFDEAAMLPIYVVKTGYSPLSEALKGLSSAGHSPHAGWHHGCHGVAGIPSWDPRLLQDNDGQLDAASPAAAAQGVTTSLPFSGRGHKLGGRGHSRQGRGGTSTNRAAKNAMPFPGPGTQAWAGAWPQRPGRRDARQTPCYGNH